MLVLFAPQCGDSGRAEDDDPRSFLMFEMFEAMMVVRSWPVAECALREFPLW